MLAGNLFPKIGLGMNANDGHFSFQSCSVTKTQFIIKTVTSKVDLHSLEVDEGKPKKTKLLKPEKLAANKTNSDRATKMPP